MNAHASSKYMIFAVLLLIYIFFILLENRLLPALSLSGDSMLFATFGKGWLHDMLPYRDLFDHKGPAIFFVNMLGYAMGALFSFPELGIVLLEFLVALLWGALTLYLFREHKVYGMWTLITGMVVLLRDAHNGGNFTEEYSLVFAMLSMVIFLCKKPDFFWRFMFYGLCGAATFLFRANNAVVPLCICIFAFLELRTLRQWVQGFLAACLGFAVIVFPTALYFYAHDSLQLMIDAALWYNFTYVDNHDALRGALLVVWWFMPTLIMEMLLLFWLIRKQKNARTVQCLVLFVATLSIGCLLSGRTYNHYMINLLPVHFFLCYAAMPTLAPAAQKIWHKLQVRFSVVQKKHVSKACMIFLMVLCIATGLKAVQRFDFTHLNQEKALLQSVGAHEGSRILNLNKVRGCRIFVATGALPQQRIFFEPTGQNSHNQKYLFGRTTALEYAQNYDFIVGDADFSHPHFEPVASFAWGILYKKSV